MQVGTHVLFFDERGQRTPGVIQSTSYDANVGGIYVLSPLYYASVSNLNTQGALILVIKSADGRIMTASWVPHLMICLTRSFL